MTEHTSADERITWRDLQALWDELRAMARAVLSREADPGSLQQPSALVLSALRRQAQAALHEHDGAEWKEVSWENRKQFFAFVHKSMKDALIDHARKRRAKKRMRVSPEELQLHDLVQTAEQRPEQVEALMTALERLRASKPDLAEIAEHYWYSGYTQEEIARVTEISLRTVRRRLEQVLLLLKADVLQLLNDPGTGRGAL